MEAFFMVYVERGLSPTVKHPSILSAEAEAKRLAKMTGKRAYVLCSIMSVETNEFTITDMRPDEGLPF